jgi:hypothetical protein
VTTDHISPAGAIKPTSPAGKYLVARGVQPIDFNSYGSRRGNDRVMTRGTFANVRIKNLMVPGVEGGVTIHHPSGEQMSIFDASIRYQLNHTGRENNAEKRPILIATKYMLFRGQDTSTAGSEIGPYLPRGRRGARWTPLKLRMDRRCGRPRDLPGLPE